MKDLSNPKEPSQELEDLALWLYQHGKNEVRIEVYLPKAKSAINSLTLKQVMEIMPKEKDTILPVHPFKEEIDEWNKKQGYNQAIAELRQSAERIWS